MDNDSIKVGSNVIGNWGAMFPWSYGKITKIENEDAYISWDDEEDGESIENVSKFNFGPVQGIGLYIKP